MYSIDYSKKVEKDIANHKKHGNKKLLKNLLVLGVYNTPLQVGFI